MQQTQSEAGTDAAPEDQVEVDPGSEAEDLSARQSESSDDDADGSDPITRDDRFRYAAQEFLDAVEALRETHAELTPAASGLDSLKLVWDATLEGSKRLSDEDKELLRPIFQEVPKTGLSAKDLVDRMWDAVKETEWGPALTYNFMRRLYRPRRQPIFHNAMLISVVAAFESHLARLAEQYYRAAPEALHKVPKEAVKEFSLRELLSMGSIEDAVEMAIEQRVTSLMFGSLADWKRFFSERMNVDLATLSGDWDSITEIFERRHCIVHSEASASRRYVRNYPKVELRTSLNADGEYVRRAMETLEVLGMLLHIEVWSKFALDRQEVIDAIEQIAFASLKEARWEFSFRIYESWQTLPLSEAEQRMAKVNLWIARKHLYGPDSIRSEVAAWDVSGSDEVYDFAKLCLLDELDGAFEMLPLMVERDKVGGRELATWPLLAPLRRDPRMQEYADITRDYLSEAENTLGDGESVRAAAIASDASEVVANSESGVPDEPSA